MILCSVFLFMSDDFKSIDQNVDITKILVLRSTERAAAGKKKIIYFKVYRRDKDPHLFQIKKQFTCEHPYFRIPTQLPTPLFRSFSPFHHGP